MDLSESPALPEASAGYEEIENAPILDATQGEISLDQNQNQGRNRDPEPEPIDDEHDDDHESDNDEVEFIEEENEDDHEDDDDRDHDDDDDDDEEENEENEDVENDVENDQLNGLNQFSQIQTISSSTLPKSPSQPPDYSIEDPMDDSEIVNPEEDIDNLEEEDQHENHSESEQMDEIRTNPILSTQDEHDEMTPLDVDEVEITPDDVDMTPDDVDMIPLNVDDDIVPLDVEDDDIAPLDEDENENDENDENGIVETIQNDENVPPQIVEPEPEPTESIQNDENDEIINSSAIFALPTNGQFATPLKNLPPLKDIDSIVTPKSFGVAKDPLVRVNSPVIHDDDDDAFDASANDTFQNEKLSGHLQNSNPGLMDLPDLPNLPRANLDDLDSVSNFDAKVHLAASFLDLSPSDLLKASPDLISRLSRRAIQYQGLQSELSFFKLNQEQINQIQAEKNQEFLNDINDLSLANDSLTAENASLSENLSKKESLVQDLRAEISSLSEKLMKSEESVRSGDLSNSLAISEKTQEIYRLNNSLNELTRVNIDLSRKVGDISQELNSATSEKFQTKLELSKASNELTYVQNQKNWYAEQLKSVQNKYTELIKKHESEYLRDSNKISMLTTRNESLETSKSSLSSLVQQNESKIETLSSQLATLESQKDVQQAKLSREIGSKNDTIELLNVQVQEKNERIDQLEAYAEELKGSAAENIGHLQAKLIKKDEMIARLEIKLKKTEEALGAELHKETELPKLAQSAEMILEGSDLGISLSALFTEFNHIKKELLLERSQKDKLATQLHHFVTELESRKPAIANYRNQIQFYEQSIKEMLEKMESVRLDKMESEKECNRLRMRLASHETELQAMKQLSKDLGRQLCFYLIHSKIRQGNEDPLTSDEKRVIDQIFAKSGAKDTANETDTDLLITERLVGFASVIELQKKNEELILAVRLLGKQLEEKDQESNGFEAAAIEEARDAILTLQSELDSTCIKLEAVSKERDLLKSIGSATSTPSESKGAEYQFLKESNMELKLRVEENEKSLAKLQSQSVEKIKSLGDKLAEASALNESLKLNLSTQTHAVELAETRIENAKKMLDNSKIESEHAKTEISFWKSQASKQEELLVKKSNELREVERDLLKQVIEVKNLSTEKEIWTSVSKSLKSEISQSRQDKEQLNGFIHNLQALLKEKSESDTKLTNSLAENNRNYELLQKKIGEKEEQIAILANQSELALKAQNAKLEQVNDLSHKLLEAKSKLAEKEVQLETLRFEFEKKGTSKKISKSSDFKSLDGPTVLASEYEDLKDSLKLAEQQVVEFTNIARSSEEALIKATTSFDEFKKRYDENLAVLQTENSNLKDDLQRNRQTAEELRNQLSSNEAKYTGEIQELKLNIQEISLKAGSYDKLKSDFEKKFEVINLDLSNQVASNSELHRRYEDKLVENESLNLEAAKLKEQKELLERRIETISAALEETSATLKSKESSLEESQAAYKEELDAQRVRIKDLEYQYNLSLSQIELKKSHSPQESGEYEDLREVVRYLRREKDMALTKVETLTEDYSKVCAELENVKADLEASKSQLSRLHVSKLNIEEDAKVQAKLVEQIEQLNILRESNITLRSEYKVVLERAKDLEKEVEKLSQTQIVEKPNSTENAVREQEINLLQEENARLKNQINDNEELKNLMKRFENLKSEFKTKLIGHRNKNRELEKLLNDTKLSHDQMKVKLEELQKNEDELKILKQKFELLQKEKQAAEKSFQDELAKIKSLNSNDRISEDELRSKIEAEKLKMKKAFDQKLEEKEKSTNAAIEARKALVLEYEQKIKELNLDLEKKVQDAKADTEKSVEKKFEFKLRVLNRKLEKLEKNSNIPTGPSSTNGGSEVGSSGPVEFGADGSRKRQATDSSNLAVFKKPKE